jgi:hypothetical protein
MCIINVVVKIFVLHKKLPSFLDDAFQSSVPREQQRGHCVELVPLEYHLYATETGVAVDWIRYEQIALEMIPI